MKKRQRNGIKAAEAGNAQAQYNLGIIYMENADFNKAEEWYLKANNQSHLSSYRALGYIFIQKKKNIKISRKMVFKKALEMGDQSKEIYNNIGNLYFNINEFEKSLYFFEKALEKDSNNVTINCNILKVKKKLKDGSNTEKNEENAI